MEEGMAVQVAGGPMVEVPRHLWGKDVVVMGSDLARVLMHGQDGPLAMKRLTAPCSRENSQAVWMIASAIEEGLSRGMTAHQMAESVVALYDQGTLKLTAHEPSADMIASARSWTSKYPMTMELWEAVWRSMWDRA